MTPVPASPRLLCRLEELPEGGARGLLREGFTDRVFATRHGDVVRVWLNDCPHDHRPLDFQQDRFLSGDGRHIVCYAHSAHFDLESGACFAGPCVGRALVPVPAQVRDAQVWIAAELPDLFD